MDFFRIKIFNLKKNISKNYILKNDLKSWLSVVCFFCCLCVNICRFQWRFYLLIVLYYHFVPSQSSVNSDPLKAKWEAKSLVIFGLFYCPLSSVVPIVTANVTGRRYRVAALLIILYFLHSVMFRIYSFLKILFT